MIVRTINTYIPDKNTDKEIEQRAQCHIHRQVAIPVIFICKENPLFFFTFCLKSRVASSYHSSGGMVYWTVAVVMARKKMGPRARGMSMDRATPS